MSDAPAKPRLDVVAGAPEQEQSLYEVRRKIYPRAVRGWFARWRWTLVILTQLAFYGTAWLQWNDRQAVLFDLATRKFYVFGLVFWPQDFIFLTGLLIISAFSLFLFTAVAGRLWCGYACPQTVYTEIFLWIERVIEGDRLARMKLDGQDVSARKFGKKALKHAVWIALALWTGFTFVGYFTPIRTLWDEAWTLTMGPWETFWCLFYGFATYGNAGWMREQVCKYMCPYARFQSVMFDSDTLVITYDAKRGEPRGSRSKSADLAGAGLGHCVDCGICVQVCPTGIDIRNGLQYECIGCAACIDGCNQVMDKMKYPRGLIRYATENAMRGRYADRDILRHVLRFRTLAYATLLAVIVGALFAALVMRSPLKVNVVRDRGTLSRDLPDGRIANVYQLQIMNTDETARRLRVTASGMDGLEVVVRQPVDVLPASSQLVPAELRVNADGLKPGSYAVVFHVESEQDAHIRRDEKSVFIVR